VANATGKRVQELQLAPLRVLELLPDRKSQLNFPPISNKWADNLVHPHGAPKQS